MRVRLPLGLALTLATACGGQTDSAAHRGHAPGGFVDAASDGLDATTGADSEDGGNPTGDASDTNAADDVADANAADAADANAADAADANAPDDSPDCAQLAAAAAAAFRPVHQQSLACDADTDCTTVSLLPGGWCIANCPVITSAAATDTLVDAATEACSAFRAAQCVGFSSSCFRSGPLLCSGDQCTTYYFYAQHAPMALRRGQCNPVEVVYTAQGSVPVAPHDLVVTILAPTGTVFADATCATPVTDDGGGIALTVPAGSTGMQIGVVPAEAGPYTFELDGIAYSWTAQ